MKILIILTGGTIGSKKDNNNVLSTNDENSYTIINMYNQKYKNCDFEVIQPFSELSENFTIDTINKLSETINNIKFQNYDGVIVTHGSDTVSYTAAIISQMYFDRPCPIVFVAANYPPDDERSNALKNFSGAVNFISEKFVSNGVYFAYANPKEDVCIYLGTRINEASPQSDKFTAFMDIPFGKMKNSSFIYNDSPLNLSINDLKSIKSKGYVKLKNSVLILKSYPTMNYDYINIENPELKSIINVMYHSGTACTVGKNTSLISFIKKCKTKDIDVYLLQKETDSIYETTKELQEAICIYNTSLETQLAICLLNSSI